MMWIVIIGFVCIPFSLLCYALCKVSAEADRRAGYEEQNYVPESGTKNLLQKPTEERLQSVHLKDFEIRTVI